MTRFRTGFAASLLVLTLAAAPLSAGGRELRTVEAAADTIHALAGIPLRGIPSNLLADAAGVAIIPNVVKAGFLLDGRFGRGVVLVRQPDGSWSNPVFVVLAGGGIGFQAGVESTDVVLIFRTRHSLDNILKGKGKLTLGGDVSIAAGPIGREAQAATDGRLKAEIFSYSRSRGLFAGASLEGAGLVVARDANERFYGTRDGQPGTVLGLGAVPIPPAVMALKAELDMLAGVAPAVPLAPPVAIPAQPGPPPVIPSAPTPFPEEPLPSAPTPVPAEPPAFVPPPPSPAPR